MNIADTQSRLAKLPEIAPVASGPTEAQDMFAIAREFSKLLRKVGVQQTRADADVVAAVKEATSRVEEVHQAALDERDRAVQAERQVEGIATVLINHLDLLERAVELMGKARSVDLDRWRANLYDAVDRAVSEAAKVGLVALRSPGVPFDAAVHDSANEIARTDGVVVIKSVMRSGWALNGRVLRRAVVEIQPLEEEE